MLDRHHLPMAHSSLNPTPAPARDPLSVPSFNPNHKERPPMAPPKKKNPILLGTAEVVNPDNGDQTATTAKAPKAPRKPRGKSDLEMPGFPKDVFDAIPAVAKKSGVPQAAITQRLKREYVAAANEAVANVSLTAQDIAREHLAELQAALDEE